MPDYKSSVVAGSKWQRSYQVVINNKHQTVPSITFYEEEIVDTGFGVMSQHVSHITRDLNDPAATFDLINPLDGSVVGSATFQDVYILLASLYLKLAADRDTPLLWFMFLQLM
jgi:hypothetical protein